MSMEHVTKVIPPPEHPVETGSSAEWSKIEQELNLSLPSDYKSYIARYGSGCIGGLLWPLNPFAANPNINLMQQFKGTLDALRSLRDRFGEELPYQLYPERGGLFPWGLTDNGDSLYWLTEGGPEGWPVVVNAGREPRYERYNLPMTEFLACLVEGTFRSEIVPSDFIDAHHLFKVAPSGS